MKMRSVRRKSIEFDNTSRPIVTVYSRDWTWATVVKTSPFCWVPLAQSRQYTKFFILLPLEKGIDGRVWMVSTTCMKICALKFKHLHWEEKTLCPREEAQTDRARNKNSYSREKEHIDETATFANEVQGWDEGQPHMGSNVRTISLDRGEALKVSC